VNHLSKSVVRDTEGAAKQKLHATFCGNRGRATAPSDPVRVPVTEPGYPTSLLNLRQMVERWLAGAHARLRRLLPVPGERSTRRTRAFPRTRAEAAASADNRAQWLALYQEVRRRYAAGETLLVMSRTMGLARSTV
jgi:hypothetical protein